MLSTEITKADNCIKIAINRLIFSPSFSEPTTAAALTITYTVDELLLTEEQIMCLQASWRVQEHF
jgi:hypothetical protein